MISKMFKTCKKEEDKVDMESSYLKSRLHRKVWQETRPKRSANDDSLGFDTFIFILFNFSIFFKIFKIPQ